MRNVKPKKAYFLILGKMRNVKPKKHIFET